MYKTEGNTRPLSEMKDKLVSWTQEAMMNGKLSLDTDELGKVVDMIKDLAEAEEKCWKACYYKKVIEAMDESHDMAKRMGYDHWRSADGRFADKGTGTYHGYMPTYFGDWPTPVDGRRMGYPDPTVMAKSIREMWSSADPKTKADLKTELTAITEEMDM